VTKAVLVTGASSGIGAAAATELSHAGFRVFGTSRSERSGGDVDWVVLDVCNDDSVRAAVEAVIAASGRLDALVCNAGFGIFGSVEEVSLEQAKAQFETNFFGVLRLLRAVLPSMREARAGRIVLVGSLSGRAPIPFQSHYSATKAALEALAWSLHAEVRPFGVRVSLVEPGDIDTGFNDAMEWKAGESSSYGGAIERCERVIRESLPKAPGPELVARAIRKAVSASRPRFRYPVGPDSRLVPFGRRLLPDRVNLALIRSHFGL